MNHTLKIGRGLLMAAAASSASAGLAAEVYYQPIVTLVAESDSNLDLDPGVRQTVEGYLADAATIVGINTPESASIIRPRIVYRDYPQSSGDDRLEAYLDFNTDWRTQRSEASLAGSFEHLDEFNAEFSTPLFNDIGPGQPVETGRTTVGSTRNSAILAPRYVYSFTPTLGGGVSGTYMLVNYSPSDDSSHVDFDYYQGRAFVDWSLSRRNVLTFGALGSKFETKNNLATATGSGGLVDLATNWAPLFSTTTEIFFQHTNIDSSLPPPISASVNKVGGSVVASYKTQTDKIQFVVRRQISPSGASAVYVTDRIQVQYDKTFSPRLALTGAVAGIRTHGLSADLANDDRNFAQALVDVTYHLTPTFFVRAGYAYAYQKYQSDLNSADSNNVHIAFGYKGLGPQR